LQAHLEVIGRLAVGLDVEGRFVLAADAGLVHGGIRFFNNTDLRRSRELNLDRPGGSRTTCGGLKGNVNLQFRGQFRRLKISADRNVDKGLVAFINPVTVVLVLVLGKHQVIFGARPARERI